MDRGRLSIKTLFISICLIFMMFYVLRNIGQIENLPSSPDYFALAISLFLNWAGFLSVIAIWMFLLASYRESLSSGEAYKIYFRSNLGKYMPGKIWQLAGMVYLCREAGVKPEKALPASLYNTALAVLTGLGIFLVTIPLEPLGLERSSFLQFILIVSMLFLILFPDSLTRIMNASLRILGRDTITERISRKVLLSATFLYVIAWFIFGWGFYWFLLFLGTADSIGFLESVGIFSGAVSFGFLAFFSPGGIGVREGIIVLVLQSYFPLEFAIFVSVSARLWITAVELFGFLTTYLVPGPSMKGKSYGNDQESEKKQIKKA